MNNAQIIKNEKEAREFLELPKTGALDKTKVETVFNRLFRLHQALLNSAPTREDREKESRILSLLKEAKNICMGIGVPSSPMPTPNSSNPHAAAWAGMPQAAFRPTRRRYTGNGNVRNAAVKFGDIFVHLGLSFKNLFVFVRAIPAAFMEMKDFVSAVLDQIQAAGIPKLAVVIALILGFLPLIHGCMQIVHKMSGLLKLK